MAKQREIAANESRWQNDDPRVRAFAWSTFTTVFKWALLAYAVTAAMIELAFVRDHTRGSSLVIVSLMLVVFAMSVPTTIAFTVARYADPD